MTESKVTEGKQTKQKGELRSLRGLPQPIAVQLAGFCCEARADGLSLDEICEAVAERFTVKMSKGTLSRKFRNDQEWIRLLKERCECVDAEIKVTQWAARKPQRIRKYTEWAEAAAREGKYGDAGRLLFLVAKELGEIPNTKLAITAPVSGPLEVWFGDERYEPPKVRVGAEWQSGT